MLAIPGHTHLEACQQLPDIQLYRPRGRFSHERMLERTTRQQQRALALPIPFQY
ncbi:hypothetical protein SAMN05660964_01217 [Thiothrix caldifontis]|uniref:Uncharacterized protein n=1 Tax=Thiothrix caldifontis TaxID=525918 RepID=A0A1H3ZL94_9GAMM|nr:hypothetical protein SAMN05660964_01217 [Thiothrix caldifontis]